jgi:hypothetical protein
LDERAAHLLRQSRDLGIEAIPDNEATGIREQQRVINGACEFLKPSRWQSRQIRLALSIRLQNALSRS